MWYNGSRSSYDLVQEAAASAAASYLRALIPDVAFSLPLVFKPGKDSIHRESCFSLQMEQG
jgi:hypothetical protein